MTAPLLTMPAPRTTPLRGGPVLSWGVVAPGGIAADFVHALHTHTDQRMIAVASRSVERAHEFARRNGIPRVHDDYAALYDDEQVQIVYIAAPHSEHRRLATDAIAAGKHVLIEKPIGLSADEAREITAAARDAGVFAMEAMWTRFLPQTDVMLHLHEDGVIGDPRLVIADLGFAADQSAGGRLFDPALGGGALLDLGVYPVWLSHLWLGAPTAVTALGTRTDSGVDQQSAVVLAYPSGAQALLSTSIRVTSPGSASISGSGGTVQIDPSFVFPGGFSALQGDARGRFVDRSGLRHRDGMAWQAAAVAQHIDDGLIESPLHPLQTSIEIMTTIDEARRQLAPTR
ncbi:Gfo/Idh/MocA family protein [Microbacterium sp. NPDC055521]